MRIYLFMQTYAQLLRDVKKYVPGQKFGSASELDIPYANILLTGQIGSGKSSAFNTMDTALIERLSRRSKVASEGTTVTIKVNKFSVVLYVCSK